MILRAKNWTDFQHYKDRSPSWIKLHRKLLDDRLFHRLPDASRALAPMLWLLASEHDGGTIPDALEEIGYRLRMKPKDVTDALNPLIDAGFFDVEQDASTTLADCKHDAIPRREEKEKRDIERREEKRARQGSQLPEDWSPTPEELEYAKQQGCVDPPDTAERFKLHHRSKGTLGKDWHSGFQYWCRNEKNFARPTPTHFSSTRGNAVATPTHDDDSLWNARMRGWQQSKFWKPYDWGPEPGVYGCLVPPALLEKAA